MLTPPSRRAMATVGSPSLAPHRLGTIPPSAPAAARSAVLPLVAAGAGTSPSRRCPSPRRCPARRHRPPRTSAYRSADSRTALPTDRPPRVQGASTVAHPAAHRSCRAARNKQASLLLTVGSSFHAPLGGSHTAIHQP